MTHKIYTRRKLDDADWARIKEIAVRVAAMPEPDRTGAIVVMIAENALLADEVNCHRITLGYKPMQVYDAHERKLQ